ncbi:MAG: hypothetical protein QME64_00800 [bacterium]|nr:hypothetical protein [bacterium]
MTKISIPWQDYCRIIISVIMIILGPILVFRSLAVPGAYLGIILGLAFLGHGLHRVWLFYAVLRDRKSSN